MQTEMTSIKLFDFKEIVLFLCINLCCQVKHYADMMLMCSIN